MFKEGVAQSMEQILAHREMRAQRQKELLNCFNTNLLVVLTLNIPGPIKNNSWLSDLFRISTQHMKELLQQNWLISYYEEINEASGLDYFILVSAPVEALKQKMIEFEENHSFGRLLDIDILLLKESNVIPVSREVLDYEPRRCFICEKPAKICARNRTHSLEELENQILAIYQEAKRSLL